MFGLVRPRDHERVVAPWLMCPACNRGGTRFSRSFGVLASWRLGVLFWFWSLTLRAHNRSGDDPEAPQDGARLNLQQ